MTPLAQARLLWADGDEDAHAELAARAARARWRVRAEERRLIRWALQGYDPEDAADAAEMERWG